jgi:hypothetical protein
MHTAQFTDNDRYEYIMWNFRMTDLNGMTPCDWSAYFLPPLPAATFQSQYSHNYSFHERSVHALHEFQWLYVIEKSIIFVTQFSNNIFRFLAYLPYFEKIKLDLSDHLATCVSVCSP